MQSFPTPKLVGEPRLMKPNLPYYLPIAGHGKRIDGLIPFLKILVMKVMATKGYSNNHRSPE